jgi:hypothetical protein
VTPAEELRAAAEKIRKLAAEATPPPWTWQRWHSDTCPADCNDPTCFLLIVGSPHGPVGDADVDRDVFAVERSVQERGEGDAAYIAAMHPGVGEALAELLDTAADYVADDSPNHPTHLVRALAVARAILGGPR